MATRLRRSRRSFLPSQTNAPLSLEIVPTMAGQAAQWNATVQLARDRQALDNLAAGHTQWFVDFAKARIKDATTEEDKTYWQSLLDETNRHVAEDTLAAQVTAGTKKLEDVQAYVKDRMSSVGQTSADYPDLLKQYTDVTNAIVARDFNGELLAAQQKLVETKDHQQYIDTLQTLMGRLSDPALRAALGDQVSTVQKMIDGEAQNARYAEASQKLVQYMEGKTSGAEIMSYLETAAGNASSPEESAKYATLASQIDTRERTIQRQGASSAAAAGVKAFQNMMDPIRHSYEWADAQFVAAFRGGAADKTIYASLTKQAENYLSALKDALPNASDRSTREEIANAIESVTQSVAERKMQMAELIARDVTAEAADYNARADRAAAANTPAGDDLASQMRYLAVKALQSALADPVIQSQGPSDTSVKQLNEALRKTTDDHQAAIDKQTGVLTNTGPGAPLTDAKRSAFAAYQDYMSQQGTPGEQSGRITRGVPVDYPTFLDALDQSGGDPAKLAAFLHLSVDKTGAVDANGNPVTNAKGKTAVSELDKATVSLQNTLSKWTNNISQAASTQSEIVAKAQDRLKALVAPRDLATGRKVSDVGTISSPVDVTDFLRTFNAPPMLTTRNAADMAPQEVNTYAGAGLVTPPPQADTSAPAPSTTPSDPYTQAEDRAFAFLSKSNYAMSLPNFDIPPIPELPVYSTKDTSSYESLFSMPSAPIATLHGAGGARDPFAAETPAPTVTSGPTQSPDAADRNRATLAA